MLFMSTALVMIFMGGAANAKTYTSIADMEAAINNQTAVKNVDILQFGTANNRPLEWIYMGNRYRDRIQPPFFVMTKDSFENRLRIQRRVDPSRNYHPTELYNWLNGQFKQTYLSNDSRIQEVTLPNSGVDGGNTDWWISFDAYDDDEAVYISKDGVSHLTKVWRVYGVRPAFYLKPDNLSKPVVKFDGSANTSDMTVTGSVAVKITCSGLTEYSYGAKSKYQWSLDAAKPASNWVNFAAPYATVTTTQSIAAVWYLHVSSTDGFGRETYLRKKYTITTGGGGTGITQQDKQDISTLVTESAAIQNTKASAEAAKTSADAATAEAAKAVQNTTYLGKSAAEWAYQAYQEVQNSALAPAFNSIFTIAQGKPFAVVLVGEELEGNGTTTVNGTDYTVVQAVKGNGYTTIISHPNHNGGTGFSDTGVKVVMLGTKKLFFVVVASPTPATVGTVNFGT